MRVVREASERRVAPGTPIHSLKKRIRRPGDEQAPAPVQQDGEKADHVAQKSESTGATSARRKAGFDAVQNLRAHPKVKTCSTTASTHVNGFRRAVDTARMKEVSEFLKSQVNEANLLLEVGHSLPWRILVPLQGMFFNDRKLYILVVLASSYGKRTSGNRNGFVDPVDSKLNQRRSSFFKAPR